MRFAYPLCLLFAFLIIFPVQAQELSGKIITAEEADELFGLPEKSFKVETSLFAKSTEDESYIYFNFEGDSPVITDKRKEIIFPAEYNLNNSEIFYVYSSSLIKELISKSSSGFLLIEKRKNVLTVTGDMYTLEYGMLCPPYCY